MLVFSLVVLFAFCWWGIFPSHSKGVKFGNSKGILEYLNVHSSGKKWLSVNGVRYKNVIGEEPYYLLVPGADCIFFVQRDEDENYIANFRFDIDEKIVKFPVAYKLGLFLNGSDPDFRDFIESYDSGIVVIVSRFEGKERRHRFDLNKKQYLVK
ncbi:MAG: hypothetical protein EOP84_03000 [Verrucomicrobiaceae bacterium]|nr:MAG: hypothetical protein EOP84_03000 [Verrucomicrobiaceae bacterium]